MKKLLVLVFAIALCLGALCLGASADGITPSQPTGSGTAENPYRIGTAEELYWFAQTVNEGDYDANAELTANITINENVLDENGNLITGKTFTQWTPICGKKIEDYVYTKYTGTFDGGGHTISGLYYSGSGNYVGLFGYVGSSGRVQNVNIADSYISNNYSDTTSRGFTGGVCGDNGGMITNCSFDGSVNGNGNIVNGGVCGWNYGTITNCSNTGSVTGNGTGLKVVGGVCGYNMSGSGVIMNCYNTGSVTGSGTDAYVGGVCGYNNSGTIMNCYNTGTVTGTGNVGGVCGYNGATIMNCYNTGSVNGSGTYTGDVCGRNGGTITNCYWQSGTADEADASAKIEAQFASGEVTWLLNQGQTNGPWRQNLSGVTDAYPTLDQSHHKVTQKGSGYANDDEHYYDNDGFCSCGAYEPATPVDGVYQISNAGQLYWFAGLVNGTLTDVEKDTDAHAVLTDNITINTGVLKTDGSLNSGSFTQWTPICGKKIGDRDYTKYTGTFDGQGYTISGLYYYGSGDYVGLFGYVGSSGRVQNVNIADSYIGNNYIYGFTGGVCGYNNGGTITNCYNTGTVKGLYYTGGVCGENKGMITNCSFSGSVTCEYTYTFVGGVCGSNFGTIENSYNAGTVTSLGSTTYVGGVCGFNDTGSTIRNCYNTGAVNGKNTGVGDFYAGGVCGYNRTTGSQNTIENCYNTGSVTVSVTGSGNGNIYAGGVCGFNSEIITNCYWLEVTGLNGCGRDIGTVTNVKSKTAEEFASGEVAWLLNQGQTNDPWRQTLGADAFPVLVNNHKEVVKLTVDEDDVSYHNKGYIFSGETNKAYFKADVAIKLPYTVKEDTELTSAAIYTVTVVYDNGTAEKTEQVVDGDTFPLPAAPSKSGYTFVHWSDGTNTYDPGDSVPVTGNVTFTAVWQAINIPDPNGITVTQPANGTVKVNPSNGSAGTLITVTATPDEGYELAYITVDGEKISGNTFRMPDKSVTVSAVFVPATFPFTDVKSGDWFYDAVAYVYANGLMDGTSATTFEPNANMTRAMVWAILARIDGETVTGTNWIETARSWAMANGVSDGENANGYVTREQLATMLWRYAGEPDSDYSLSAFTDADSVSDYAETAMAWAVEHGIISGMTDTTIEPQGTATRAQCAAMLMRFVEL